ncbi:phosphate/phosphite/phosphonate ABC transporter substrate-binding protein [Natrialbaceae archaeon A-gly3]
MKRRTYLSVAAGSLVIGAGCLGGDEPTAEGPVASWADGTIEFGLPPFQDQEELENQYAGLFEWLEEGFEGVTVKGIPTTDYSSVIESVSHGHTELANLSPLIYVMAADEGITPLAVNELGGKSSYHAYVATKADSGIDSLEDLEGKEVAMVDPLSTSGGLFPLHMLEEAGLDTGGVDSEPTDLEIDWTFGHNLAVDALEAGHVDAAAYGDFEHPEDDDDLGIVAESPPIPLAAAVARPDTPEEVVEALTDRLLETPEDALEEHIVSGFGEYDPEAYDLVREVAENFGVTVSDLDETED